MSRAGAGDVDAPRLAALTVLGLAYLLIGILSIANWCSGISDANRQIYPNLIPGNLGFVLVALTVGASLIASTYYALKGDQATHVAVTTCGSWLALGALVIQILVTAAVALDTALVGEELDLSIISECLLRLDVILGFIILPVSALYTSMLKKMIKK